jgi:hypothetical protein
MGLEVPLFYVYSFIYVDLFRYAILDLEKLRLLFLYVYLLDSPLLLRLASLPLQFNSLSYLNFAVGQ